MRSTVVKLSGFAIVSAIFILVVLAALGAFILSISTSQQMGSMLDVQGVRAYHAARTGIEWGLYRQLRDGSCPGTGAPTSFSPAAATLSGFTITVTCSAAADTHDGPTVYTIISTACNSAGSCPSAAPGTLYVERRLEVSF
jgi:MSHA biogenesis protein MshP